MFKHTMYAVTLAAIICISIEAQASPISPGDAIAVDFAGVVTHDAGGWAAAGAADAPNFNIFDSNTTIPSGSVNRHSDNTVVDGVSITFGGATGFNNDDRADGWPGTAADPYYVSAADDLAFAQGAGCDLTLTFAGLDDLLLYNVRVYSMFGLPERYGRTSTFTVTNGAGTESIENSQGDRWLAATLEAGGTVFSSVSTDGSGQIVVSMVPTSGDNNPVWNAIVLEAAPEPATLALCVMGLFGLTARTWRKRRAR